LKKEEEDHKEQFITIPDSPKTQITQTSVKKEYNEETFDAPFSMNEIQGKIADNERLVKKKISKKRKPPQPLRFFIRDPQTQLEKQKGEVDFKVKRVTNHISERELKALKSNYRRISNVKENKKQMEEEKETKNEKKKTKK